MNPLSRGATRLFATVTSSIARLLLWKAHSHLSRLGVRKCFQSCFDSVDITSFPKPFWAKMLIQFQSCASNCFEWCSPSNGTDESLVAKLQAASASVATHQDRSTDDPHCFPEMIAEWEETLNKCRDSAESQNEHSHPKYAAMLRTISWATGSFLSPSLSLVVGQSLTTRLGRLIRSMGARHLLRKLPWIEDVPSVMDSAVAFAHDTQVEIDVRGGGEQEVRSLASTSRKGITLHTPRDIRLARRPSSSANRPESKALGTVNAGSAQLRTARRWPTVNGDPVPATPRSASLSQPMWSAPSCPQPAILYTASDWWEVR